MNTDWFNTRTKAFIDKFFQKGSEYMEITTCNKIPEIFKKINDPNQVRKCSKEELISKCLFTTENIFRFEHFQLQVDLN